MPIYCKKDCVLFYTPTSLIDTYLGFLNLISKSRYPTAAFFFFLSMVDLQYLAINPLQFLKFSWLTLKDEILKPNI